MRQPPFPMDLAEKLPTEFACGSHFSSNTFETHFLELFLKCLVVTVLTNEVVILCCRSGILF